MSPSSRRAWIEIVDWQTQTLDYNVALLAEGVDRNGDVVGGRFAGLVALLAEGVDRNYLKIAAGAIVLWSPSSRRAWIEIGPW